MGADNLKLHTICVDWQ